MTKHACISDAMTVCAHALNPHPSAMVGLVIMLVLLAPTMVVGVLLQRGLTSACPEGEAGTLRKYEGTDSRTYETPQQGTYEGEAPDFTLASSYLDLRMCQSCESPLAPWHWRAGASLGDGGSCVCATPWAPIPVSAEARHWFERTPSHGAPSVDASALDTPSYAPSLAARLDCAAWAYVGLAMTFGDDAFPWCEPTGLAVHGPRQRANLAGSVGASWYVDGLASSGQRPLPYAPSFALQGPSCGLAPHGPAEARCGEDPRDPYYQSVAECAARRLGAIPDGCPIPGRAIETDEIDTAFGLTKVPTWVDPMTEPTAMETERVRRTLRRYWY